MISDTIAAILLVMGVIAVIPVIVAIWAWGIAEVIRTFRELKGGKIKWHM